MVADGAVIRGSLNTTKTLPIIGIGASAGGLEALEQFFSPIPSTCGAGFIVIQHLDPTQKGILPELLQRVTPMKVAQAEESMTVKAGCVYVIPSNRDLSISHGKLHLTDPIAPRGLRLPIDFFLSALAADQHELAIGVILSGMGSDGSLGLRAIKENAGLAVVQSPASSKFDPMPRSAINTGLADIIAPPEALWEKIASCLRHKRPDEQMVTEPLQEQTLQSALAQIVMLLQSRTGNDFSLYKKNTLYRRIIRRMGLYQFDSIAKYVPYLRENVHELDLLFKELLIGVTRFFRDAPIWEQLKTHAIPELLAGFPNGKEMRAWVPACSTGEEAYSLAMVFKEAVEQSGLGHQFKLQIFATDLDADAIEKARQGFYLANIASNVSPERLARFFVDENNGFRVNKEIREMVIFAPQNVIIDPPFTKLDLLFCRNLLIYLETECQKKLLSLFHYSLTGNGLLLLGNAESIDGFSGFFANVDSQSRLFRRLEKPLPLAKIDFPLHNRPDAMTQPDTATSKGALNLQSQVEQLLLKDYSPPAVLVNAEGDILFIHGRTGKYLEPAAGRANLNVHAMAREGLRHELASALKQALLQPEVVVFPGLTVGTNGNSQRINLSVQAIVKPDTLKGTLLVIFTDIATPKAKKRSRHPASAELQAVQDELQQTREQLSSTQKEMQNSKEELNSLNEELQSTNEELQSSNEELVTSKEEMQSMNEELQSVNAELQAKVTDLSWVNNDVKNLLNSMEIATVFLDNALHVRRYTSHATHLFKLIPGDMGRPLSDIVTSLDYPKLLEDTQNVLQTLVFIEKQVKTHDGRWFKVRIMPYRTQDNVIDGVVITLIDITETKQLEAQLRSNDEKADRPQ